MQRAKPYVRRLSLRASLAALCACAGIGVVILSSPGCGVEFQAIPPVPDEESHPNAYGCECVCTNPNRMVSRMPTGSTDDAEERLVGGAMLTAGSILEIPDQELDGFPQIVGVRFPVLGIPRGAQIVSAQIQFTAHDADDVATEINIFAEASDDALPFTDADFNISARPRTVATLTWTPAPWLSSGDAGSAQLTPNLGLLVQELVDRAGYSPVSSIAFIFDGFGRRRARSFDGDSANAPVLVVEYAEPDIAFTVQACMPDTLNPNLPGNSPPTTAQLASDCANRVENTVRGLATECLYPACNCELVPGSARYVGPECNDACAEVPLTDCESEFNPVEDMVTATNVPGDDPVCTANSPVAASIYGQRSACLVTGQATVAIDGEDTKTPAASGIVEIRDPLCPGGGCNVGITSSVELAPITYSNLFDSATFSDLTAHAKSLPGQEASIDPTGLGIFGSNAIEVAGRGRRDSDFMGMFGTNDDVMSLTVQTAGSPSCSLTGALAGSVNPEIGRCENNFSLLCGDDSMCADEPGCTDGICNCLVIPEAATTLALNVSGPIVNQPPDAEAGEDQTVECNMPNAAQLALDGSASSDPDGNFASFTWLAGGRTGTPVGFQPNIETIQAVGTVLGYVLRVIDTAGQADEDGTTVSVVDTTAPTLHCNNPASLWQPNTEVSFTATAEDICDPNPSVEILDFQCTMTDGRGVIHDKTRNCRVMLNGDSLTITKSSGAKTVISWTVRSTDASNNVAMQTCSIEVAKP